MRPLGESGGSISAHRSTGQLSCWSATEHDTALSIIHRLKCMARTRCLCAALPASTGRGPFPRDKPDTSPLPWKAPASLTVQAVLNALPAMPSSQHWSCSSAGLPYHVFTFLSQIPLYFPQAASPVWEGRREQPCVITAWLSGASSSKPWCCCDGP